MTPLSKLLLSIGMFATMVTLMLCVIAWDIIRIDHANRELWQHQLDFDEHITQLISS